MTDTPPPVPTALSLATGELEAAAAIASPIAVKAWQWSLILAQGLWNSCRSLSTANLPALAAAFVAGVFLSASVAPTFERVGLPVPETSVKIINGPLASSPVDRTDTVLSQMQVLSTRLDAKIPEGTVGQIGTAFRQLLTKTDDQAAKLDSLSQQVGAINGLAQQMASQFSIEVVHAPSAPVAAKPKPKPAPKPAPVAVPPVTSPAPAAVTPGSLIPSFFNF